MTPSDSNPLVGRILSIRGQRVVLDADLARLYGVPTKRFNEAVKRNTKRFPKDFAFQLTREETGSLRSQFATVENAAPGNGRGRHRKYLPWAFIEHGAVTAANVLRSEKAVAMSVYVVRAFVKMRDELATSAVILRRLAEVDKKLVTHDVILRDIYEKLRPLLAPPPEPPGKEMGFHVGLQKRRLFPGGQVAARRREAAQEVERAASGRARGVRDRVPPLPSLAACQSPRSKRKRPCSHRRQACTSPRRCGISLSAVSPLYDGGMRRIAERRKVRNASQSRRLNAPARRAKRAARGVDRDNPKCVCLCFRSSHGRHRG